MPGPGSRGMSFAKPKNMKKTLTRILGYFKEYRIQLVLVAVGILVSAGANITGTYLLKPIINDYIVPWIGSANPDFTGLIGQLTVMAAVYTVGILGAYGYNRLMITVSTGTLLRLRGEMFSHMQKLPIVKVGQKVLVGDKLGVVGSTGLSTGNHLHFEVRKNGESVNPLDYVTPS